MADLLGVIGRTEFSVAVTREPWTLPVDRLILSASATGLGSLGAAAAEQFPEARLYEAELDVLDLKYGHSVKTSGPTLTLVNPRPAAGAGGPEPAPTAESVAAAAQRGLDAGDRPRERVALSLLGSGAAGLPVEACAAAIVPAVRSSAEGRFDAVYFIGADERAAAAVR
ncbi:MAG TPA: hypothetical protein VLM05_06090, partial [Mycobacteriales bacterium]|nr:hypothetical protein [Mycobacteriales bacterium]